MLGIVGYVGGNVRVVSVTDHAFRDVCSLRCCHFKINIVQGLFIREI